MGGNKNNRTSASSGNGSNKSGVSAFPIVLASLGWLLAALLFSFVYMGMRSSVFCENGAYREGVLMSILNASGAFTTSVVSPFSKDVENRQQLGSAALEHTDDDQPLYCKNRQATKFLSEAHLLDCAARMARQRMRNFSASEGNLGSRDRGVAASEDKRIAFMFVTRGWNQHERLWKRFFKGHENLFSLYTHTDPRFRYQNSSIFYKHQIPSINVRRFSITLVDAMRRLLAHAILDPKHGDSNWWFLFLCEKTIPLRSFEFTHKYLVESQHSFVEAFLPSSNYLNWNTKPFFERNEMRKGELWMAIHLRHAIIILEDWNLYYLFKERCSFWCTPDEQYIQTLLALKDPLGIENRTVMYVKWPANHGGSPFLFHEKNMPTDWFKGIQERTVDKDGEYHDSSSIAELTGQPATKTCYHNGIPNSPCFLFARKIDGGSVSYINRLPASILGY